MAEWYEQFPVAPAGTPGAPPPAAPPAATAAPTEWYEKYPLAPQQPSQEPRTASGVAESLRAGFQGSAPGLAWRGRLPDLVINPEHSAWWERALSGVAQIGMELPLMIGGAIAGAPAGAAMGTAVAPGAGTAAGALLGAGAGMGIVPAAIRESLIQAYKSGEIKTAGEFWAAVQEVAKTAAKEGAINAIGMGGGAVAARTLGKAIAPAIGQSISVPTATAAIAGADVATQIATLATMPAALQGRLPDLQEILDAAILVGGLHLAGVTASKITNTYMRTGKTPAEQVADAQRDPEIARDLTTPPTPPAPEYIPPSLEPMLKIQENLFTETARLGEMEARAATTPLSDMERIEFNTLRAKVLDLENQLKTGAPELARTPTYTADQFVEAKSMADQRLVELTEKAGTDRLNDLERAERVFLTNSLDKPDALARHFGFEPQIMVRPSPEQFDASAKAVYDDALARIQAAYDARRAAGRETPAAGNAEATATILAAEARNTAGMLGRLPMDVWKERGMFVRDESQKPDGTPAEKPAPPEPPTPAGPAVEVDLFGEPIVEPRADYQAITDLPIVPVKVADLTLSDEVPQFKGGANKKGVVKPLEGIFDPTGVVIQGWERMDGRREVISGRHRFDLAQRTTPDGNINIQIHREADGFTRDMAATLDAILNIRDEQGSVADYVQYFKASGTTKADADAAGLLARFKGKAGFSIARDASDDLLASHRADQLSDEAALAISSTAPGSARLQALGIAAVQDGKTILYASNLMRSVDLMAAERMAAGQQGDIFGFDDSALREASTMAKKAVSKQRAISEQISAVSGASKRPEIARKMGVNVEDPAAVQAKIIELKNEQYLWDNWPLYPELVAKLRDPSLKQDDIPMLPETPAEAAARDRDAAQAAMRSVDQTNQTDTPAFKAWFDGSAVVHGGRPFRVYHHTNADITEFKGPEESSGAIWFTGRQGEEGFGRNVEMPVYLSIKKPYRTENQYEVEEGPRDPAFMKKMRAGGYDGIIYADPANPTTSVGGPDMSQFVVFKPTQIKSAIGNRGTFDPNDPNILYQNTRDTWYRSALGEAVNTANIKAAPAKGWQDFFKGQVAKGGIKADEIKWSGVEEWLDLQTAKALTAKENHANFAKAAPVKVDRHYVIAAEGRILTAEGRYADREKDGPTFTTKEEAQAALDAKVKAVAPAGRVTKEQVADYLANNGVKVEEVMLGGRRTEIAGDRIERWLDDADREGAVDRDVINAAIAGEAEAIATLEGAGVPGSLLQPIYENLESGGPTKFGRPDLVLPGGENYRELLLTLPPSEDAAIQRALSQAGLKLVKEGANRRMVDAAGQKVNALDAGDLADPNGRAATPDEQRAIEAAREAKGTGDFSSSHFDQPNILAHVRFNERTDAEGKKVLFIEEFQSDWAQKGKKEGFKGTPQWLPGMEGQENGFMGLYASGVPQAPFVGKTDAWVSLAIKRMISYAAQNGFDRIAWTRGEQQVERYISALRKAVDVIEWTKTDKGVQLVGYKGKKPDLNDRQRARLGLLEQRLETDGTLPNEQYVEMQLLQRTKKMDDRAKVVDTTKKEDALSDAIGKAMAEKILQDPNQTGTIEGEGIRIDSTGMAGFYDRIVPKVANDVLKKLGGGRVGEAQLETGKKTDRLAVVRRNDGQFAILNLDANVNGEGEYTGMFKTRAEAEKAMMDSGKSQQQSFDITPAMVEKATAGLPLFQKHLGSYEPAERMATLFAEANESTLLHEAGHHFLENLKYFAEQPNAPARVLEMWDTARKEFSIGATGKIGSASHEHMARAWERYIGEGVAPSEGLKAVFDQFKEWLLAIYKDLANIPTSDINPKIRKLFDRILATDEEIAAARDMGIPRAYVPEARAAKLEAMLPPEQPKRKIEPGFQAEQISMRPFADEIPHGPGEAPDTSRVNLDYVNSPDDLKLLMDGMAEIDQTNIQKHRGGTEGVESWEAEQARSEQYLRDVLGGGPDTLNILGGSKPGDPMVNHRTRIMKQLLVAAAYDSAKRRDVVLEAGHDATVLQQLEYMASIERARMLQAEFLGQRAAVGRALNALKDTREGSGEISRMLEAIGLGDTEGTLYQAARTPAEEQAFLKAKLDEIMQNYKGKTVLDIAKLHKEIGTLKGTFKFTEEVSKATKWEMIIEGWKSGLLSGPVTHTTNLFGTGAFMAMRAPVDFLSAMIGMARGASPGMGESNRASMSEGIARITGMMGGVQDGIKLAAATFRLDDPTGKTEAYRTAIPGRAGEIIRIPLRLMGAEDALVNSMYQRGELRTMAIRQAFDEHMNPGTREFAARVQQLVDSPTEDMKVAAETAATRMTFNAPLGEKGVQLQLFVAKWNLQWMIPFIRTPINIAKELARMSPFAPIVGEWRADIAKGGVARDRALAEVALGTAVMGITVAYAFAGNISGSTGPDPGKTRGKAGVWQPNSILIGDTWYEYGRIQPTGTLMVLAADMAAVWDHMNDDEKDKIPKMLAIAFSNAVTNQTFLQGISNFVNAMGDPTRFAPRFLQSLAGSTIPNIIAQPTAMADPVVREVNGMLDAVQARLPGFRQNLLPSRDWLGEPREARQRVGVILPSRTLEVTKDKVRLEAARLDMSMAAPPRKTHIGKGTGKLGDVELTPEEIDTFEKVGGEFAHQILDNIVNSQGYDQIPDVVKQQIFRKVITAGRRIGAVAALPPEKRMAYLESITEKVVQQLQPGETQ